MTNANNTKDYEFSTIFKVNLLRDRGWKKYSIYKVWIDPTSGEKLNTDAAFQVQMERNNN